jgi:hypothetical protein
MTRELEMKMTFSYLLFNLPKTEHSAGPFPNLQASCNVILTSVHTYPVFVMIRRDETYVSTMEVLCFKYHHLSQNPKGGGSMFLINVGFYLQVHTALLLKKSKSEISGSHGGGYEDDSLL